MRITAVLSAVNRRVGSAPRTQSRSSSENALYVFAQVSKAAEAWGEGYPPTGPIGRDAKDTTAEEELNSAWCMISSRGSRVADHWGFTGKLKRVSPYSRQIADAMAAASLRRQELRFFTVR